MSSSDAVVAQSAFNTLRLGSSVQIIVGRLLRFWDSKNIKKQGEIMGITLLLLDKKNSVIHGFIPTGRAPYYCHSLPVGSVRSKVLIFLTLFSFRFSINQVDLLHPWCGSSFLWVRFRHCDSLMMYRGIY
ncbi:hypothetical protein F2Q70_00021747 [Brassica cretica]|uniref:Uncharacterized protein n=1 Tax=Brassica cretica TaxID=69181 RepID=A0A8S9HKE7_BRACR|nr:hypothetical protein F2Q70_00021747 [Brassica cretica]KAF2557824.1 hypothetical protein F2Q68_00015440 [Brassica cretica]